MTKSTPTRGRPRKPLGERAEDVKKPVSLYLPFVQSVWLREGGADPGPRLERLILAAEGVPATPGPIEGDSAKDAVRLSPGARERLDELVAAAVVAGDTLVGQVAGLGSLTVKIDPAK